MSRIKLLLLYLTLNMFLLIESFKSKEILLTLFVVIAVVFVCLFFYYYVVTSDPPACSVIA